jgi:sirohydrochlorin cobaltochelatase
VRALLLIELDAPRPGAGATLIRLAAKARALGVAPVAAACFLHDARPTFAEAFEACVSHGASEVTLVPYALTVSGEAAAELERLQRAAGYLYPQVTARLAAPLGDHPAVAQVVMQRAAEADYVAAHPFLAEHAGARPDVGPLLRPLYLPYPGLPPAETRPAASQQWRPLYAAHPTALLLAVAGPHTAVVSRPLYALAEQIRRRRRYAAVRVCCVAEGRPGLDTTLDELAARAINHVLAVPCALHGGDPVIAALNAGAAGQRERRPSLTMLVAEFLGYDRRLVEALADRMDAALRHPLTIAS